MVDEAVDPVIGEDGCQRELLVAPAMGFEKQGPLFVDSATDLEIGQ